MVRPGDSDAMTSFTITTGITPRLQRVRTIDTTELRAAIGGPPRPPIAFTGFLEWTGLIGINSTDRLPGANDSVTIQFLTPFQDRQSIAIPHRAVLLPRWTLQGTAPAQPTPADSNQPMGSTPMMRWDADPQNIPPDVTIIDNPAQCSTTARPCSLALPITAPGNTTLVDYTSLYTWNVPPIALQAIEIAPAIYSGMGVDPWVVGDLPNRNYLYRQFWVSISYWLAPANLTNSDSLILDWFKYSQFPST